MKNAPDPVIEEWPGYLYRIFTTEASKYLSVEESKQLVKLIGQNGHALAKCQFQLGQISVVAHSISTSTVNPIKQQPRQTPKAIEEGFQEQL